MVVESEISVTDVINGYRILVDFEFDVIFEDREGGEHGAGRHEGRFATVLAGAKLTLAQTLARAQSTREVTDSRSRRDVMTQA